MTGASFHHRLTGGGEAARLIDYRPHLCIQGCCCGCCSCRGGSGSGGGAAAVAEVVEVVVAAASNKQSSTCFLSLSPSFFPWPSPFPPFIPLIAPSFPSLAPPAPPPRTSTYLTYLTGRAVSQALKKDGSGWMARPTEFLFLSSLPPFSLLSSANCLSRGQDFVVSEPPVLKLMRTCFWEGNRSTFG